MKQKVSAKLRLSREEAADYLEALVKTLREGTLYLQTDDDDITLEPGLEVSMKLEGSSKEEKQKFSLSMSWSTEEATKDKVILSSVVPEPAAEETPEEAEASEEQPEDERVEVEVARFG